MRIKGKHKMTERYSNLMKKEIFHIELENGIYLLSSTEFGTDTAMGTPTANSYLVVGEKKAVLIDLTVDVPGIRLYAEELAQKPLQTVITHCHPDHIYRMSEFDEVMFHKEDSDFPLCEFSGISLPEKMPRISYLDEGDELDLSNRTLRIFHVPGHTLGSILLLDSLTGTLFSGDTVARRLLYGLTGAPSLPEFLKHLQRLESLPIRHIQSAHDRVDLGKRYISHMIDLIENELSDAEKQWQFPGFPEMINLVHASEDSPDYFDCAVPKSILEDYKKQNATELLKKRMSGTEKKCSVNPFRD